jgi:hypothetical protein
MGFLAAALVLLEVLLLLAMLLAAPLPFLLLAETATAPSPQVAACPTARWG